MSDYELFDDGNTYQRIEDDAVRAEFNAIFASEVDALDPFESYTPTEDDLYEMGQAFADIDLLNDSQSDDIDF